MNLDINSRHCWMCLSCKPVADFYVRPKYLCKQCCAVRTKAWAEKNPARRKALTEKYRKTPRGAAAYYRRHKAWREKNGWCDRERARRESAKLSDFYIRTLLKKRGNKTPTPEQISNKRLYIQTLRAKRNISILIYGARIKN